MRFCGTKIYGLCRLIHLLEAGGVSVEKKFNLHVKQLEERNNKSGGNGGDDDDMVNIASRWEGDASQVYHVHQRLGTLAVGIDCHCLDRYGAL